MSAGLRAGRILVAGRQGQLARALAASGRVGVTCLGRPELDLARAGTLAAALDEVRPDVVINAGAYTAVDRAEAEPEIARALNADGPASLARLCAARAIPFIHVSTDCVFDGTKPTAYAEADEPRPLSAYGVSKRDGERAVAAEAPQSLIVRVSWVFSEHAGNFVRTMLSLAASGEEVTVVNDQIGYPTYCPDLADGLLAMADGVLAPGFDQWGLYHLAGTTETNRAAMAQAIFEERARIGGPVARLKPVATVDYPTPARRPLNARLDSARASRVFGVSLPDWRVGLGKSVHVLVAQMGAQA